VDQGLLRTIPKEQRLSNTQTKESKAAKVRLFTLAKDLDLAVTVLVDHCKDLGFSSVKNQLSTLDADQVDSLKERIASKGKKGNQTSAPAAPKPSTIPAKAEVKILSIPKTKAPPKPVAADPVAEVIAPVVEPKAPVAVVPETVAVATPTVKAPVVVAEPAAPSTPYVAKSPNLAGSKIQNLSGRAQPKKPAPVAEKPPVAVVIEPEVAAPVVVEEVPAVVVAEVAPVKVPEVVAVPPVMAVETPKPVVAAVPVPPPAPFVPPAPVRPPANLGGNRPINTLSGTPRPSYPQGGGSGSPQGNNNNNRPNPGGPRSQIGSHTGARPNGPQQPPRPGTPGGGPSPFGPPKPAGAPITGKGPPVVAPRTTGQVKLTPEMLEKFRKLQQQGKKVSIADIQKTGDVSAQGAGPNDKSPVRPGGPDALRGLVRPRPDDGLPPPPMVSDEEGDKKRSDGGVSGRDGRHKARQDRSRQRGPSSGSVTIGVGGTVDVLDNKYGSQRGPRAALLRKMQRNKQLQALKKEGPVEISPPITVRSLSEAIGMKTGELSKRLLKETSKLYGNNSPVEFEVAELIAVDKGIQLILKVTQTAEGKLLDEFVKQANVVDPTLLKARAPIVTIMGHVDHGKTSLLDKIRIEFGLKSDVVSTEAGGITQVIRAWQVEKEGKQITFLDTPGHEAFTKMRARGANVTDIVVIVVAATDGVMPQTEEAISHARAAKVAIVVAINKIDMPNANLEKTRRQLYSLNLLPDNMGGDIPFVETSAMTGQGISELLEQILLVAELAEPPLTADPDHKATGTCLEAYMVGQEGVMATVLVRQGTLRKGDIVLCGSSYGRVRAMYNDMGLLIDEAGPSTPVKITGLDEVPNADDPFYAVDDVSTAREIAEKRKDVMQRSSQTAFAPVSLESLTAQRAKIKMTELKIIIKAEARGSVEAIKKELEKLVHEEVCARVLHAGIGAITGSDVILALTSPEDTLVIGFNVTADDAALALAEERGISIREYDIIYKMTDDVKAALEGKLKPVEEVIHLGRAIVRDTFKVSKVGTIAGCHVTSGTIERSARVRVIRDGVILFPTGDRVVGLDSLKRFKDDAKDVREGFECGMRITGFDDIKIGDVIEAFKIEIRYRTL